MPKAHQGLGLWAFGTTVPHGTFTDQSLFLLEDDATETDEGVTTKLINLTTSVATADPAGLEMCSSQEANPAVLSSAAGPRGAATGRGTFGRSTPAILAALHQPAHQDISAAGRRTTVMR